MSHSFLYETIDKITELDGKAMEAVRTRQQQLTKPPKALGHLEMLSEQLAGITGEIRPALSPRTVLVCAGDHGVTAEGVSPFPSEVTQQMVLNFLVGGAAINVLSRQFGAKVMVIDVGVAGTLPQHIQLRNMKVRSGTRNLYKEPAMSREEAIASVEAGMTAANAEIRAGAKLLLTGDMGIGNTTPSAAIASVLTGLPAQEVTGPGTGLGLTGWRHKCEVIAHAIELHRPNPNDALDVLSKVGGFELGAIAGIVLAAAAAKVPVVIDGVISTAGAAIATGLCPASKAYMISGHRSREPGHQALLNHLDLKPLLELELALGEGTGAVLSIPILEAAVNTLNEMATFEEAQVSGKEEGG